MAGSNGTAAWAEVSEQCAALSCGLTSPIAPQVDFATASDAQIAASQADWRETVWALLNDAPQTALVLQPPEGGPVFGLRVDKGQPWLGGSRVHRATEFEYPVGDGALRAVLLATGDSALLEDYFTVAERSGCLLTDEPRFVGAPGFPYEDTRALTDAYPSLKSEWKWELFVHLLAMARSDWPPQRVPVYQLQYAGQSIACTGLPSVERAREIVGEQRHGEFGGTPGLPPAGTTPAWDERRPWAFVCSTVLGWTVSADAVSQLVLPEGLLTPQEAADLLNCGPKTLMRRHKEGILRRYGGKYLRRDIEQNADRLVMRRHQKGT